MAPRLSKKRIFGLDRSGPPPDETLSGRPWRPLTVPNAIGYARLALIPVFLVIAYSSGSSEGVPALAAAAYFVAGVTDYLDGLAARLTGQYSRMGAILDPVIDRLLVIAGIVVCWSYELLPRWALALMLAREVAMLILGRRWLRLRLELRINWPGRIAVGPTMLGLFLGLVGARTAGEVFFLAGLVLAWVAFAMYVHSGLAQLRARREAQPPGLPRVDSG